MHWATSIAQNCISGFHILLGFLPEIRSENEDNISGIPDFAVQRAGKRPAQK